jgi:RNA polymerase sigma-70 factor (ECF subfamily)
VNFSQSGPDPTRPAMPVPGDLGLRRWQATVAGDEAALQDFLDEEMAVVYGFLLGRLGGDREAAADLVQETLLEALKAPAGYRGEALLSTWLCAIARRRLARHWERERRQEVAAAGLRVLDGGGEDPGEAVPDREDLFRALSALPAIHRQVLVMKYLDGMAVEEIAAELGRSRVQVQSLLQRAREGFRRAGGGRDG